MRHDKLQKELELLAFLAANQHYTVSEICEQMDISRRSMYYYLHFFEEAGFKVENSNGIYHINRESPFFRKMFDIISFTEDEAVAMQRLLLQVDTPDAVIAKIKRKFERFYDFHILADEQLRKKNAQIVSTLYDAVKYERQVWLRGYSSANSNTTSDRLVEPFLFMNNNREIRCYELASGMNKTFKLARMTDVEMLEEEWQHRDQHKQLFTDIFAFSGEERYHVRLRMGRLSANLIREEYPASEWFLKEENEGHWLLGLDVCSFLGIGRFVLGLYDDIEVLGCDAFKDYLRETIGKMNKKV